MLVLRQRGVPIQAVAPSRFNPYARYAGDPCGYAREVLGVEWWGKQQEIAQALLRPPYKVLVKASHKVGKTHLAGGLVNWWYDVFEPGLALTTAPTDLGVRDLLWKEVRVQRGGRGGFRGPKMPRLESAADHWAHGFTARESVGFQGRHERHMLFVFDEAVGVDGEFWEATESMFSGAGHAWLAIFNPTDTSSRAYIEELSGDWQVITMSVLDHPNVAAEAQGERPPFPSAIRLARVDELLRQWCRPVSVAEAKRSDVEWPPGSGQYLRPGPIAEARLLGRWPSQATYAVWSDGAWQAAEGARLPEPAGEPCEIGVDVARYGDDFTEMHVRRGPVSLYHEAANGLNTREIAGRVRLLADEYGRRCGVEGRLVVAKIDDGGVGGGVVDQADGYTFVGVNAAARALDPERYPNRRSELWFSVAGRADEGLLDLSRLPAETLRELRRQAMGPRWALDSQGRRVVEDKSLTKRRIKRSPDGMDGLNLAYAPAVISTGESVVVAPAVVDERTWGW